MRIDERSFGGLVAYGIPEEWAEFAVGLEDLYLEFKHDVLPAAVNPNAGGVTINLKEAIAMMAVMQDDELTRSLMTLIVAGRSLNHRADRE